MSSKPKFLAAALVALVAVVTGACDKAQLLAPSSSTITVSAPVLVLPNGGSTEVTAYVIEEAGTPVQNGTNVRFTTNLGSIAPETVETRNGLARATFTAGSSSGVARIRAMSGNASHENDVNFIDITVGTAAIKTVTLRANPASVGPSGGTVDLIASVVSATGQGVEGVLVTFTTDQGTLGANTATTNGSGEARTTLTTSQEANITAAAGAETTTTPVKVAVRAGPIISIKCEPSNCAGLQGGTANNSAIALLTVTKGSTSSALRNVMLDFGDGESINLGNLASGTAVVSHAYAGPSGSTPRSYTATVRAEDINGEVSTAFTSVVVSPRAAIGVSLTPTGETPALATGQRWTFAAAPIGDTAASIQSYEWNFGDGATVTTSGGSTAHIYTTDGQFTVRVTLRLVDGRTASTTTEVLVDLP